jgi:hypothetical protein
MTGPSTLLGGDSVLRRAMFVLELVDPVTSTPVGAMMEAKAEGLRAPSVTRAGQFVWLDIDPPADRSVKVSATARHKQFAPFEAVFPISKRTPDTLPTLIRRGLQPTGLYQPPAGRLAAAGMLIKEDKARDPIAGAQIVLVLTDDKFGTELRSRLVAITDERGGFVTVAAGFDGHTPKPAPRPAPDGSVIGWLEITWQSATRKTTDITLRQGQLNYLAKPLVWADLTP